MSDEELFEVAAKAAPPLTDHQAEVIRRFVVPVEAPREPAQPARAA